MAPELENEPQQMVLLPGAQQVSQFGAMPPVAHPPYILHPVFLPMFARVHVPPFPEGRPSLRTLARLW